MTLFQRIATRVIARARRTPYFPLCGYMDRFWLFRIGRMPSDGEALSVNTGEDHATHRWLGARVHRILRSDEGRTFHDHPWTSMTLILRGGYHEVVPVLDECGQVTGETSTWHGAGSVVFRRAAAWHRLELPPGRTAWTLFLMGPWRQSWGFLTPYGKVDWRAYFSIPENSHV